MLTDVLDGFQKISQIKKDDAEATSVAMEELVFLEEEIIQLINEHWGMPMILYFSISFVKALYYSLTIGLGIDDGFFAVFLLMYGVINLICAHLILLPAAMATDSCISLMGAVNNM